MMDYKARLQVGLLVTAIITPLLLSNIMPPLFAGVVVLVAGVALTYFWALDYVKESKIQDMSMMVKALESLSQVQDEREVLSLFIIWAKKLTNTKEHYLWVKNEEVTAEWQAFMEKHSGTLKPCLVNDKLPSSFSAGLFIPVIVQGELAASAVLVASEMAEIPPIKVKLIQPLLAVVIARLGDMARQGGEQSLKQELLQTVIRATEGYNPLMVGHSSRVAKIALPIGKCLGLNKQELKDLEYGAILHDIGQMGVIYDGIMDAKMHPELGAAWLPVGDELAEIKAAILYHHEHYDTSGYPEGLGYTDIPLTARIIAVADTYDAVTSLADDEARLNHGQALAFIKKGIGTFFDPLVVVALEEVENEVSQSLKEYSEKTDN